MRVLWPATAWPSSGADWRFREGRELNCLRSAPTLMTFAMAVRAYQICTRCVMDTSDPLIRFDEQGRCNLCTDFLENRVGIIKTTPKSDAALEGLIDRVRK